MEQSKTVEVDGYKYLIQHGQVEAAWDIGVELMKMIGGSAASMATAASGGDDKLASALTNAVKLLLEKLDAKASMHLMKRVLSTVECQGSVDGNETKKILMNDVGIKTHFQGRLGSMLKLVGESIAFTHADFFEAISDGIATMMKQASDKMAA